MTEHAMSQTLMWYVLLELKCCIVARVQHKTVYDLILHCEMLVDAMQSLHDEHVTACLLLADLQYL